MSMCISTAQAVLAYFLEKKTHEWLVKCPCAFRLRRLTRNGGRGISIRHFPFKFPHKMVLVKCPHAFRLRGARHFSCKSAQARTKRQPSHRHLAKRLPIGSLYRDLVKRPLMEFLLRNFAKRPLIEILPTELL